jgi:hypothetical protein
VLSPSHDWGVLPFPAAATPDGRTDLLLCSAEGPVGPGDVNAATRLLFSIPLPPSEAHDAVGTGAP